MVRLVPMTQDDFDLFLEHDIREYALERAQAGFWTEGEALEQSRKAHHGLLPQGLETPHHCLYTIQESEHGKAVGVIWMQVTLDAPRPSGFILDIEIDEPFRRKGYARQAMLELEAIARVMGIRQLGLNVFAQNTGARTLYGSLGYTVVSLNMLKPLAMGNTS